MFLTKFICWYSFYTLFSVRMFHDFLYKWNFWNSKAPWWYAFLLKAVIKFSWRNICFYRSFLISENKKSEFLGPLYKGRLHKCYKVYGDYIGFNTEQAESTKSRKYAEKPKKTKLENTYLYKAVLSKIVTKHE